MENAGLCDTAHRQGIGATVNEREELLRLLAESEERYRDLVEQSHDLICTHDLEGRILSANQASSRNLGIPVEDLLRMNISDLLVPAAAPHFGVYLEDLQRSGAARGQMVVSGRNGEMRVWQYENKVITGPAGEAIVRGLAHDVTEHQRAIRALERDEIHLRSIIESTSDIIGIIDTNARLQFHSPSVERDLGYETDRIAGSNVGTFVHPDDLEPARVFFRDQIARPDANQRIELRLHHADGTWRLFEVVAKNQSKDGAVVSVIINARDITDRKLLTSKLEQANRVSSLGRLAATVAHEFNNVLMGMQPFSELLQMPGIPNETVARAARQISSSIQRGKRVALDLLRFTQPATPMLTPLALDQWWQNLSPEMTANIGNKIALTWDIPAGLTVLGDAMQLQQVIANLITNARDAMPAGGSLTIRAEEVMGGRSFSFGLVPESDPFVRISVADTGTGIPAEIIENVFDPLFTTKPVGGTGLGLAVAHQVVARHGGYLFVESEVNRGTVFHVLLRAAPKSVPEVGEPSLTQAPRHTHRILLVDDEPLIVEGMSAVLVEDGFAVSSVTRGADAAEAILKEKPDLVMLDVGLPDIDGFELGREIRKQHPALPLIFATGHGDARLSEMPGGLTALLYKPFDLNELLAAVAGLEREKAERS